MGQWMPPVYEADAQAMDLLQQATILVVLGHLAESRFPALLPVTATPEPLLYLCQIYLPAQYCVSTITQTCSLDQARFIEILDFANGIQESASDCYS